MRALLLLVPALTLAASSDPRFKRFTQRSDQGRNSRGLAASGNYAFFEALPASGAGAGSACACAIPTGAKGETLAFTRASTATCTKGGFALTGIANGDLTVCATDNPRIEVDPQGYLSLLDEAARTQSLVRAQELDNAIWLAFTGTGGSSPTVTANAVSGPDTTTQASNPEQVVFAATSGTQSSGLAQAALTAAAYSAGYYVQAASGSCTLDLCIETNSTGPVATCSTVTATAGSWARAKLENVTSIASGRVFLGNLTSLNGGTARSACTAYVWQVDAQAGAWLTSPIYSTSATVTRAAEPGLSTTLASAVGPTASIAASLTWPSTNVGAVNAMALGFSTANMTLYRTGDTAAGYQINVTAVGPAVSSMGLTTHRSALADNAGTRSAFWDGASVTAPANSMSGGATALWMGIGPSASIPVDGLISRICVDPDPTRCR